MTFTGILPSFNGTLDLDVASTFDSGQLQAGLTFDLFDWAGTLPESSRFDQILSSGLQQRFAWNTEKLYTSGEITLVPEPGTLMLAIVAGLVTWGTRRRGVLWARDQRSRS